MTTADPTVTEDDKAEARRLLDELPETARGIDGEDYIYLEDVEHVLAREIARTREARAALAKAHLQDGWGCRKCCTMFTDEGLDYDRTNRFAIPMCPTCDDVLLLKAPFDVWLAERERDEARAQVAELETRLACLTELLEARDADAPTPDMIRENLRLRARVAELEQKLVLIGERAVVDWDDQTVGDVDAAVKAGTYNDWIKDVMSRAEEHHRLRAQVDELCKLACTDDVEVALGWVTAMVHKRPVGDARYIATLEQRVRELEFAAMHVDACIDSPNPQDANQLMVKPGCGVGFSRAAVRLRAALAATRAVEQGELRDG